MNISSNPHVSEAIRQLRPWVTAAAAILAICCATQMLVYGFAAYTAARWDEVKPVHTEKPLRVVGGAVAETVGVSQGKSGQPEGQKEARASADGAVIGGVRATMEAGHQPVEANKVHSVQDLWMSRASDTAAAVGTISAVMLAILTMLGVVIAGGACVPGVERATTACVWSLVLAVLCLPWERLLPGLGLPGIFSGYADMTHAIDTGAIGSGTAGTFSLFMQWVGAPLVAMFTALGVVLWFRAGVERGVIVLSPSEFDRAVEREVEMIQKRGVGASAPKAVGALNRAIGAGGADDGRRPAPPNTLSAVEQALEEAASIASSVAPADPGITRRRIPRTVADADFKRPI